MTPTTRRTYRSPRSLQVDGWVDGGSIITAYTYTRYRIITILSSALSCLAVGRRRRRLVVYAHIFMSKHIKTMHECRLVLYGQYLLLLLLLGFIILWSVRLGSLRLYPDKLTGDRSPPTSRDCASCPLSRLTGLTSSSRGSVDSILLIYWNESKPAVRHLLSRSCARPEPHHPLLLLWLDEVEKEEEAFNQIKASHIH